MSDMGFYDALGVVMAPPTKQELEIYELRKQMREASQRLGETTKELAMYRELFKLGWREGELQWRLSAEHVLSIESAHGLKLSGMKR